MKYISAPIFQITLITAFVTLLTGISSADLVSYWAFDDHQNMTRSLGTQGTLSVSPEGWWTKCSFPSDGTPINRINYGQTSYEYMLIDDPLSVLTTGYIKIENLDFTGYSDLTLSFAEYVSYFGSYELNRYVVCYVDGVEKSRQTFDIIKNDWDLTTIDLPSVIENEDKVRIELEFHDLFDIAYKLHIDNIQITGIPEPSAVVMAFLAGNAVLLRSRRR